MSHQLLLIIHLAAATVWVGGHLYVAVRIVPGILKKRDASGLLHFEKSFEPLGMPSLLLLVITGIWMMYQYGIRFSDLLAFKTPIERAVSLKIIFLTATVLLAISAQTRVIPKVKKNPGNQHKIIEMAVHVILVTLLGLALLTVGSFISRGGI